MASTVLVSEALRRASALLNDDAPQFTRYPERELVDWLNDGCMALFKYLPTAASRINAIKLVPGTRQSIGVLPAGSVRLEDGSLNVAPVYGFALLRLVRNMGTDGLTVGRTIRVVEQASLDAVMPLWHQSQAETTGAAKGVGSYAWQPTTPMHFYVCPGVRTSPDVWVEAAFCAYPTRATLGDAGALPVGDEYLDDVVNYMVARAHLKQTEFSEPQKGEFFEQLFLGSLNARVVALTGASPNLKRLPFAPVPVGQAA